MKLIEDGLRPHMMIHPVFGNHWNWLSGEERLWAEWFAPEDYPETPDKIIILNPYGYWWDC